jgi:hypothetical protein
LGLSFANDYFKPTFIRKRENSRVLREPNRREPDVLCSHLRMKKAQSKLLAANPFMTEESRNKVAVNKSWFAVFV